MTCGSFSRFGAADYRLSHALNWVTMDFGCNCFSWVHVCRRVRPPATPLRLRGLVCVDFLPVASITPVSNRPVPFKFFSGHMNYHLSVVMLHDLLTLRWCSNHLPVHSRRGLYCPPLVFSPFLPVTFRVDCSTLPGVYFCFPAMLLGRSWPLIRSLGRLLPFRISPVLSLIRFWATLFVA